MIKLTSLRASQFKQLDDVSLSFPRKGSVLIQGLNEAGKSTLFESIFFALFGKGLVTEDNSGRMDDLIHYQAARAFVKLAFATDDASFIVGRQLNRAKPNTAVLDVAYANGKHETVTNLSAVNKRIVAELGLDGEALLNSCFVEQKKLEKLESMNAQQRRDTLLRLLNLDKLSILEAQYKPSSADEAQLRDLRDRLTLAEIQRDLPAAVARLEAVQAELRLIEGLRLRRQAGELEASVTTEEQEQQRLHSVARQIAGAIDQVERLKQLRDLSRAAGETLLGIEQDEHDAARMDAELTALRAEASELPLIEAEVSRLEELAAQLTAIAAREHALAEYRREMARLLEASERVRRLRQSLDERQTSLQDIDRELAGVQRAVEQADEFDRRMRQVEVLRGWLQIREVALLATEAEHQLGRLRQDLFDLEQVLAERTAEHQVKQRLALGMAVGAFCALALGLALLAAGWWLGILGLPAAALLGFVWSRARRQVLVCRKALQNAQIDLVSAQTELNRHEGAQDLAQRTNQDPRRLNDLQNELETLGLATPASVGDAQALLGSIESSIAGVAGDTTVRQRLGALQGRREALWPEMREIKTHIEREGDPDAQRLDVERVLGAEEASVADLRAALDADATDVAGARERAAAARAAQASAVEASRKATELSERLLARQERLASRRADFACTRDLLAALLPAGGAQPGSIDACRALWREAGEQLSALDEPALRRQATELTQHIATSQERASAARRSIDSVESQLALLDLDAEALARCDVSEHLADDLLAEQRELLGRAASLRDRQGALDRQLGLQAIAVDHHEAEQALGRFEEQIAIRKQAYRIISLARRNIVNKVLPSTVRNMRLLLPLLTNDRYRDVEITDDYKIRVWDDTARALKAKDIYSGGTRDQFSLALRLAFALATLPEELGTAPGFIFLDEPLSSFDNARTDALVNLLTRGAVAANFEQIFVITHNRAFDPQLFDYHLQLEGGRIVASDLPELEDSTLSLASRGDRGQGLGSPLLQLELA